MTPDETGDGRRALDVVPPNDYLWWESRPQGLEPCKEEPEWVQFAPSRS